MTTRLRRWSTKVEQVARLIRSKGVGVYFVTQNPDDIPEDILGQLGNRVQHALRAFTARDQKALRLAAETYRPNPRFDIEEAIKSVGTGEAVTSMLEDKGVPGIAEQTLIRPPSSQLGPITPAERKAVIDASPIAGKYEAVLDRESAFEVLSKRAEDAAKAAEEAEAADEAAELAEKEAKAEDMKRAALEREFTKARRYETKSYGRSTSRSSKKDAGIGGAVADLVIKELKGTTGRRIVRGILGGLFKAR